MGRFKVTVVGAGNVGATAAQRIADAELADVVMIDILEGIPQGKGLDMLEACPISRSDVRVTGTNLDKIDRIKIDLNTGEVEQMYAQQAT